MQEKNKFKLAVWAYGLGQSACVGGVAIIGFLLPNSLTKAEFIAYGIFAIAGLILMLVAAHKIDSQVDVLYG